MDLFKLVPVDDVHPCRHNVLVELWTTKRLQLANLVHLSQIPSHVRLQFGEQKYSRARIIILNSTAPKGCYTTLLPQKLFPFCSIYKSVYEDHRVSMLDTQEALRPQNYLLCVEVREEKTSKPKSNHEVELPPKERGEYRIHVSLEEVNRYQTKYPAYVNLDRSEESIGFSSWDGNLVSWFESGFTTRVQYALQSGLLTTVED